jgi:hypothetical protein
MMGLKKSEEQLAPSWHQVGIKLALSWHQAGTKLASISGKTSTLIINKLLHFFRFKAGKFSKFLDGDELVGFFPQAPADVVQDPVAGFFAFAGDALNVFGIYAYAFGLHFP